MVSTDEQVDITPYDRRKIVGDHEACTLQLVFLHHPVSVSFATVGTKTILFHVELPQAQSYVLGVMPVQVTIE